MCNLEQDTQTSTKIPEDVRERFYFVIVMPVNKYGQGPEMNFKKVEKLTWEVWSQELDNFGSFDYLCQAIQRCEELNKEYYIGT